MWHGLGEALSFFHLTIQSDVLCWLRGAGGMAFAAGADISRFAEERSTPELAKEYHHTIDRAMNDIYECRHPTVALIEGVCRVAAWRWRVAAICGFVARAVVSVCPLNGSV